MHDASSMPTIGCTRTQRLGRPIYTHFLTQVAYLGFPQRAHTRLWNSAVHFFVAPAVEQGRGCRKSYAHLGCGLRNVSSDKSSSLLCCLREHISQSVPRSNAAVKPLKTLRPANIAHLICLPSNLPAHLRYTIIGPCSALKYFDS
jgi:hypothetical protein